MTTYTLYHNPKCSKSRAALQLLEDRNITFVTVPYLEDNLSISELEVLLNKLKIKPLDLLRQKDAEWTHIPHRDQLNDQEIIAILAEHPILIERPILANNNSAVIGRPIKNIIAFLEDED